MEYLLDTNICIYIIKKKPIGVFEKFKSLSIGSIGISSITLAELQYGIMKSSSPEKNQEALDKFITPLEIIDFDYNATIEYGKIRADLEQKGTSIGPLDTLIAAHAKSLDLILVTNNEKEFERILELKLENWTK
jgi:tRNA(fMet)-specific endonuclease VapC